MAILGPTFKAAQMSSVLIGAFVPVLAWRLAVDVAEERRMPTGRARSFALGVGLTSAVYLPLVLGATVPDSTAPFTVLALVACLLMTRIAREPRGATIRDPRLIALGVTLGLAALTRNEAVWLALIWAGVAWFTVSASPSKRARLIAVVAVVAAVVFAPWAYRNLVEFGTPLPGQAVANALYLSGYDIFAWNDPPTLARYLAQGPAWLVGIRLDGIGHNLFDVLLFLGVPVSFIGLAGLFRHWRGRALGPLLWLSLITFWVTGLVFPAATQWGTFLHGAGPVHVLLVITALLGLDAAIVRIGRWRGWTRPVAWLGPALAIFGSALFSIALLPIYGSQSAETSRLYDELGRRMAGIGHPLDRSAGPVISNFPIWLAETQRIPTLGLPNEPPSDVLDLAHHFAGTRLLVLIDPQGSHWPADLTKGLPDADCFRKLDLGAGPAGGDDPLATTTVYQIVCP